MELITQTNLATSSDLLSIINEARLEYGEKEVRRNDFVARCKDELDGEHYESFVVKNSNGTESEELRMTADQCAYVSMRESKSVRRRVTEKLNAARAFDPTALSRMDILKLALESEQGRIEAVAERDKAIATKAQIGSKREATAMANVAKANKEVTRLMDRLGFNARHATIKAVEGAVKRSFGPQGWRPLSNWCKANGATAIDVPDPLYGSVKSWPADAWGEIYDVDLKAIFPATETAEGV